MSSPGVRPELNDQLGMISNLMSLQMQPFMTPISGALSDGTGIHVGTGGYIDAGGRKFLLTNEHVAAHVGKYSLARKSFDSDDYLRVNNPFVAKEAPEDLAMSVVDDTWNAVRHSAMTFPHHRFTSRHETEKGEYLFLMGFTGEKAYYSPSLQTLVTRGTPLLTQEIDPTLDPETSARAITHPQFDPTVHFALHWQPDATTPTDGSRTSVPNDPHGLSGSFVWNCRLVEFNRAHRQWSPGVARLTGIIWGWSTSDRALFATRIEYVHAFIRNHNAG